MPKLRMRAKGSGGAEDANPHHATVTPTTRAVDSVWTYVVHLQLRERGSVRLEVGYSMIMILFRARLLFHWTRKATHCTTHSRHVMISDMYMYKCEPE